MAAALARDIPSVRSRSGRERVPVGVGRPPSAVRGRSMMTNASAVDICGLVMRSSSAAKVLDPVPPPPSHANGSGQPEWRRSA